MEMDGSCRNFMNIYTYQWTFICSVVLKIKTTLQQNMVWLIQQSNLLIMLRKAKNVYFTGEKTVIGDNVNQKSKSIPTTFTQCRNMRYICSQIFKFTKLGFIPCYVWWRWIVPYKMVGGKYLKERVCLNFSLLMWIHWSKQNKNHSSMMLMNSMYTLNFHCHPHRLTQLSYHFCFFWSWCKDQQIHPWIPTSSKWPQISSTIV